MTRPRRNASRLVAFSFTAPRACPYLPERQERLGMTSLADSPDPQAFLETLAGWGFRRSGRFAYRPVCTGCKACVAVRIPVTGFTPSRSQRRIWRRNGALEVTVAPPRVTSEHFDLFSRYQEARHAGGDMEAMDYDDLRALVDETPVDTHLVEARRPDGTLAAVSLTDWLTDGLSGVYKFFDPELSSRSPGTWLILWHVEHARRTGLDHVYLGYWIARCHKMSYKTRFRPLEALMDEGWVSFPEEVPEERL